MTRSNARAVVAGLAVALGLAGVVSTPASAQERGNELVSPADGGAYDVYDQILGFQGAERSPSRRTTPDGDATVYELRTNGTLPGMAIDGDANDPIVARRAPTGWTWSAPLADRTTCARSNDTGYAELAIDASRVVFRPWCGSSVPAPGSLPRSDNDLISPIDPFSGLRLDLEQRPLYTVDVETDTPHYVTGRFDATGPVPRPNEGDNSYIAGSADLSTVYFSTNTPLTPDADPFGGLYRWRDGTTTVMFKGFDGVAANFVAGTDRRNAIAADGDLVTGVIYSRLAVDDDANFSADVYQTDGDQIAWISRSEFAGPPETPADMQFEGASADGRLVFFATTEKMVGDGSSSGDLDVSQDIYVYDAGRPVGARLALVSAGDPSCVGAPSDPCDANADSSGTATSMAKYSIASDDGGEVFFITGDVLHPDDVDAQQSLYLRDVDAGTTTYLVPAGAGATGDMDGDDAGSFTSGTLVASGSLGESTHRPIALSADGGVAAFLLATDVDLPSGRGGGDADGTRDLYVWTDADGLRRVRQGVAADANTTVVPSVGANLGNGAAPQAGRAVAADGGLVFFQTADPLVAEDVNGRLDVYTYDTAAHAVELISPGNSPSDAVYHDASASGDDVFFLTSQSIDPSRDTDRGHVDLYDARVGGGFAPLVEPPTCDPLADACQESGGRSEPANDKTSALSIGGDELPGVRKALSVSGLSSKARRRAARSGRLTLTVRVNKPARVTAVAVARIGDRVRRVASRSAHARKAGKLTLRLRLDRSARERLGRGSALRLVVTVTSPAARSRTMTVRLSGAGL